MCTYLLHLEGTILHTTFLPIGLRTKQVREQPIPNYSGGSEFLRERLSIAQQASYLLHLEGTILHTTFLPGLRTKQAREQPTPNYSGGSEFLRERLSRGNYFCTIATVDSPQTWVLCVVNLLETSRLIGKGKLGRFVL